MEVKLARRSGRGIRRLVTLCGTPTQLVAEYDRCLLESEPDGDGGNDGNSSDNDGDVDSDEHLTAENKKEIKRSVFSTHITPLYSSLLTVQSLMSQTSQPRLPVIPRVDQDDSFIEGQDCRPARRVEDHILCTGKSIAQSP